MTAPFRQLPFARLPDKPRLPHPYLDLEPRTLALDSQPFGRINVHYREHGDGPPLLLIHGLMTTGYSWRYMLEPLGKHYRLLVPDLVGAGRSDKPARSYLPEHLVTFLGELQQAFDIRGCRVIGNSLGGYLCMRWALRDPEAMSRLVNIHSPAFPLARLYALRTALSLPGSHRLLDWLIHRNPRRWVHKNVHYWDESLKSLEEAGEYALPLQSPAGRAAFTRYLAETLDPAAMADFIAELRRTRLSVPLRLMYSRRDPMVPPSVGDRLAHLLPEADMIRLDDCSHFMHVDNAGVVAPLLLAFLNDD